MCGNFHRSTGNLVKCIWLFTAFGLDISMEISADIFVKFLAKSPSNVGILFLTSKARI